MGGTNTKPSEYVKKQWINDDDTSCCFDCRKLFSATRRRHHCRCCGEIYCSDCWGKLVRLPPDYGYMVDVSVCNACELLFAGSLKFLRLPRRIVLTRALKDTTVEQPPLSKENVSKRSFEVFFVKVAHWRPFTDVTHLQFSITLRTANGHNSSHFNQVNTHSPMEKPKASYVPTMSGLDLDRMAVLAQQQQQQTKSQKDGESDTLQDPSPSGKKKITKSAKFSTPGQDGGSGEFVDDSSSQPSAIAAATKGLQLDIAWTLPLDALLRVMLDGHEDGDYITLETAQELYRIQCADIQGSVTAEQKCAGEGTFRAGSSSTATRAGGGGSAMKRRVVVKKNNRGDDTSSNIGDTGGEDAEDSDVSPKAQSLPSRGMGLSGGGGSAKKSSEKKRVQMGGGGDADPMGPNSVSDAGPSRSVQSIVSAQSAGPRINHADIITSKPLPGAVFTPNAQDTRNLFLELQVAVKIMIERQKAKDAKRRPGTAGGTTSLLSTGMPRSPGARSRLSDNHSNNSSFVGSARNGQ